MLKEKKKKLQTISLDKIEEYFSLTRTELAEIKPEVLHHLSKMARLGMQFEKEMNLSKRATDMNFIRVGKLVSQNKKELIRFIRKNLPEYK